MIFWSQVQLEASEICSYNIQGSVKSGSCRELIYMVYLLLMASSKQLTMGGLLFVNVALS